MPAFLISYALKEQKKDYRSFNKTLDGLGDLCPITDTTMMLYSDFEIDEIIDGLSEALGDRDVLFVVDLETLEVDGVNLPECVEDYLSAMEDFEEEEEKEEEEEEEEEEEDKKVYDD